MVLFLTIKRRTGPMVLINHKVKLVYVLCSHEKDVIAVLIVSYLVRPLLWQRPIGHTAQLSCWRLVFGEQVLSLNKYELEFIPPTWSIKLPWTEFQINLKKDWLIDWVLFHSYLGTSPLSVFGCKFETFLRALTVCEQWGIFIVSCLYDTGPRCTRYHQNDCMRRIVASYDKPGVKRMYYYPIWL